MNPWLLVAISVLMGAVAQICLKYGVSTVVLAPEASVVSVIVRYFTAWPILLGLSIYGSSAVLWLLAISKVPLSSAYPMLSFGYVIVSALSYLLFGETVSLLKAIGLAVICLGILILSRG